MDNKVITSQGNVQFQFPDGKIVNVHPNHIYTVFNEDTVSFILVGLPKSSGLAMMASKAEDLEVNGQKYTIDELPSVLEEAFAEAGAQARCEIVDELPESGYTNTIYLVPQEEGEGYDEYIWLKDEERWELIGDTDIEMKNYLKKVDFNAYSAATKVIIDNEISARTQGDITLDGKIDQEIADRASDVDAEEARAISAETALQTAIDDEISARTDADTAEQTAREAADSFISGAVDTVSSGLTQEVQRAQNAESGLSDSIDAEEAARATADSFISGAVDTVSSNLNSEISRATSAETELSNAIANETNRATSAETALQTAIDGLEENKASYIYVDAQLQTKTDNTTFDAFVSDFEAYSGNVATALGEKASQSDLTTLSGNVTAHVDDTSIHLTSGDVQTQIEDAIADKLDVNVFEVYSAATDSRIAEDEEVTSAALNAINDRLSEDEEVTAAGLNSLNEALSGKANVNDVYSKSEVDDALVAKVNTTDFEAYSGAVETALAAKQDALIAGENITISGNVISSEGGGKAIEAGRGISITTGETADTVSIDLPISAGTGNNSIKCGGNCIATKIYSAAFGNNSQANGTNSFAINQSTANGQDSFSQGTSYAEKNFSAAFGRVNYSKNDSELSCGRYNNSVSASTTFGDSGNTLFSVGNGTANNARHNAFEIRQNGDIYITKDGSDVKLQDQLGGSSYTAGDGIDISNDVISVSGVSHNSLEDGTKMLLRGNVTSSNQNYTNIGFEYYYGTSNNKNEINLKPLTINGKSALRTQETSISVIDTSAITTSISSGSTDAQVPSAKAVNDKLGGLSLVQLTQAEYDALATKDNNTLYVIVG